MCPSIEPYDSGHLDVGDRHAVYREAVGSPDGLPAIWLLGGPGAPASPGSRRNFDPARYRAVIFDQRGCGRSRPWHATPSRTFRPTRPATWSLTWSACARSSASTDGSWPGARGA
jgi:proline iminopeptidase